MSPLPCPVCKALNEQGPQCRRCRADLSLLFLLEEQRRQILDEAYRALAARDWTEMLALVQQAQELRHDEETARLAAVATIIQHDFATAWQSYRELQNRSEESV